MQREHLGVPTAQNLVADLDDQGMGPVVEPLADMVGAGRRLLQERIGRDHLPRDQILPDAKMLQRALSLGTPELVRWHLYIAETVGLNASVH